MANQVLEFDFSQLELNDTSECHITFPDGRLCYMPKIDENNNKVDDETKPLLILLYGSDSKQARTANLARLRKLDKIEKKRHKDSLPSDSEIEARLEINREFVAELTCGWKNFKESFTREQALDFYKKYPIVYEQVDKHIADRTNYVKK